jgi:CHAT domain-containing protein
LAALWLRGPPQRAAWVPTSVRTTALAPPRIAARDVAAGIPDDATALLEYVTGSSGAPTTLFVVTRAGLRAVRLPSADSLVSTIRYLLAAVEGGDDVAPLARRLGDAVLRPALDSLPASVTRLVVVPDGALHRVPFDVLRLPDGRAALERYEISVAPSAAIATLLWRRPQRSATTARILAFGDPAVANVAAATAGREDGAVFRGAFEEAGALARLPASGREARRAARFGTNSVALVGSDASAANLARAPLDSFDVLHFATHALVDERSLMRSAVVLASGGGRSGFVTPGDLAALHLSDDLVVLSSCRSAGGVVVDGEGVQGLTAPLLSAGARAVVASAWPIEDRETAALVEDFYSALARREPVGAALRSAKLAAMRRGAPVRAWASFSVVGDPMLQIPLAPPRPSRWWVWVVVGAVGVIGGAATMWRRSDRRPTATGE